MKKHFTPKLKSVPKTEWSLQPKQSTLDFITQFAATFETPKEMKIKTSGYTLN